MDETLTTPKIAYFYYLYKLPWKSVLPLKAHIYCVNLSILCSLRSTAFYTTFSWFFK